MKYRRLGKTDLRVSVIGMGTWQFGGEWGKNFQQDEADRMFDAARSVGVNLIDTAECYGDHTSEAFIGNATHKDRDHWIIATKFGHKFDGPFQRSEPREPRDILQQVEASLKALKTDHIDLLQFHSWDDVNFNRDEVRDTCQQLLKSGKILHLGNSVRRNNDIAQIARSEDYDVQAIQIVYNRINRKPESEVFPLCRQLDLGVMARVPLASGFLSGKYKPGDRFAKNDTRSGWTDEQIDGFLREAQQVKAAEVPADVPMARWALAWVLQNPAVTCVIPGCKNVEQVLENARAADLEMVRPDHPQAVTA